MRVNRMPRRASHSEAAAANGIHVFVNVTTNFPTLKNHFPKNLNEKNSNHRNCAVSRERHSNCPGSPFNTETNAVAETNGVAKTHSVSQTGFFPRSSSFDSHHCWNRDGRTSDSHKSGARHIAGSDRAKSWRDALHDRT